MRRLLPLLILLAGCGPSNPVAAKIDLPIPGNAEVTGGNEKDQGTQMRYEITYATSMNARALSDYYKEKGIDMLVQGETASGFGKTPGGQLIQITLAPKEQEHEVKVVAIAPKSGS